MREETGLKPKPMVDIGGRPVLWHLMKIYSQQGIRDFVVLAGYKSDVIKSFFLNFDMHTKDITVDLSKPGRLRFVSADDEDWTVTILDTGEETQTGERLLRAQSVIGTQPFHCTYGDGLAPVDLTALSRIHKASGAIATMTVTKPSNRFGVVEFDDEGIIKAFREKPKMTDWVNMGFFLFQPEIFDFLEPGKALENSALQKLSELDAMAANPHAGFWEPMDTFREYTLLNELWDSGNAPWKVW